MVWLFRIAIVAVAFGVLVFAGIISLRRKKILDPLDDSVLRQPQSLEVGTPNGRVTLKVNQFNAYRFVIRGPEVFPLMNRKERASDGRYLISRKGPEEFEVVDGKKLSETLAGEERAS